MCAMYVRSTSCLTQHASNLKERERKDRKTMLMMRVFNAGVGVYQHGQCGERNRSLVFRLLLLLFGFSFFGTHFSFLFLRPFLPWRLNECVVCVCFLPNVNQTELEKWMCILLKFYILM